MWTLYRDALLMVQNHVFAQPFESAEYQQASKAVRKVRAAFANVLPEIEAPAKP